jgi:Fe-S cluster assembly iron-binding protein IscA
MSEATAEAAVELTENAARRIAEILTNEPAGACLRIGVLPDTTQSDRKML